MAASFVHFYSLHSITVLELGGHRMYPCRCPSAPAQYTGFHRHSASMPGYEVSSSASFHIKTKKSLSAPSCSGPRRTRATMMPVGVPRVPYRLPRSNYWAWVDIWNCLYRERIVFLSKVRCSHTSWPLACLNRPSCHLPEQHLPPAVANAISL